jgi:ribose transport system permease protein
MWETRLREQIANPLVTALFALALVFALGLVYHAEGAFYKWSTHRDMLRQASVKGILACGMTIVILMGGIDLAVGSVLALSAVCFAMFSIHWGWPAWAAIIACLAIGSACGATSGTLTARFRIQPFIVTLAMMVFARGLAKYVSGGVKISQYVRSPDGRFTSVDLPAIFGAIDSKLVGGNLTVVTVILLICVTLVWVFLKRLRWGRYVYAIGGNEEASRLSGVPVAGMKVLAYGLCGLLAALAGVCQAAQETQGDPETGLGYELDAISMVVIGGTALAGGRGGVGLTLLGVLTIGYIEKILSINAVSEAGRLMLTGGIVIAAVLLQRRNS